MAIPDKDVAAVRAATDIAALIGEKVGLRRQGTRLVGLCPFHTERSPSFSVSADAGFYYCFGCGASGDAISFVRATEHVDFVGAVEFLAARAGIAVRNSADVDNKARTKRKRIEETVERAVQWYHERLLSEPDAGAARNYLRSRGLDGETVREFRLGWAPEGWDTLCRALALSKDLAKDSGLGFENRRGRLQDSFRGRIMFPIFEPGGKAVAFGGRILPGQGSEGQPKYVNSPDTPLYSKRRTLYGLNWAKTEIASGGSAVICEGYTDVIACFSAGVRTAVATCGTALAEEHFSLLRNFARRVVLAYDADGAGQAAAERFYEWERRHEMDIAVASLPAGKDPAELAQHDPAALAKALADARPFLAFRLDRMFARADLSTAEGRARAANEALATVAGHPDPLVRDQYVMAVANRCQIEPDRLRARMEELSRAQGSRPRQKVASSKGARTFAQRDPQAGSGGGARTQPPQGQGDQGRPNHEVGLDPAQPDKVEAPPFALEALRLAVWYPERVASRLEACCFPPGITREAYEALVNAPTLAEAVERCPEHTAALLRRLAVEGAEPNADAASRLIDNAAQRAIGRLQAQMAADPVARADLWRSIAWLKETTELLRASPDSASEAEAALVTWLHQRSEEEV